MEAVASQTVGDVAKILIGYITKHVRYLTSYAEHVEHMKNRMKQLEDRSVDVKEKMDANDRSNKTNPQRVSSWLDDVKVVQNVAASISTDAHHGCINIIGRHQAAVKALKATKTINILFEEDFHWSEAEIHIPSGRVKSKPATNIDPSTSSGSGGGDTQTRSKSRDRTFNVALHHLQQDNTHVIALCGMGGVGKTTLMEQLKTAANKDKKMFDWIAKTVVGENFDLKSIQHALAVQIDATLESETDERLRADNLHQRFEKLAQSKERSLLILDDVWKKIELSDIGLISPLPNGVKLLLTSRSTNICRLIAPDVEVVQVNVLEESEARDLFFQITGVSNQHDHDLYEIGGKIVKKCGGLPLAIKVIAATLKSQGISVWKESLRRMKKNKPGEEVQKCMEISYTNIKEEEDRAIFRLCGMFPEDYYIPIEDLTRYAWGLKLLEDVSTMEDARNMTETCVRNLVNANLLMDGDSDNSECVKMHDIVLTFVVDSVSKGEDSWIIDHGGMTNWNKVKMSNSCKQISLACKGGFKFPQEFKFPNLSFLKLFHEDTSLRLSDRDDSLMFPHNFYGEKENLRVLAYDQMSYPLLPTSSQCSTILRTLCLHNCQLNFDISCIGGLSSLGVLSFANSRIKKLPSTFKNLKKLRTLDLTGCDNVLVVDDGVLKSLVILEELYVTVRNGEKGINFTNNNCNELKEVSKKLSALDIEFFANKDQLRSMSYERLTRFRISVGCLLKKKMISYENTLMLVTNRGEILDSRINKLFENTKFLFLTVDGMNNLADIEIKLPHFSPQYSSFHNLRDLIIKNCGEVGYVFTVDVAKALSKLESLEISSCPIMEELIHIESNEAHTITFPKLKNLDLSDLPKLTCLCNIVNQIELPQLVVLELAGLPNFTSIYPKNKLATSSTSSNISTIGFGPLLNEEVKIRNLEKLKISNMKNLKEIWACENTSELANVSTLREITVMQCNSLVNLFPCNPMPFLQHLEELTIKNCGSIELLFNIDMDYEAEIVKYNNSRLTRIIVYNLGELREIWRLKGVNKSDIRISSFQAVETIRINRCERFISLFTPSTSKFDMTALVNLYIDRGKSIREPELIRSAKDEINVIATPLSSTIFFSQFNGFNLVHNFHHLHNLKMRECNGVELVFEIDTTPSSRVLEPATTHQKPLQLFPYLEYLKLRDMKNMSHVWKCNNWNEFLILQKHLPLSSFHNLTTICMISCNNIKYLFSPLMAKLLSNLRNVEISCCDGIEEVVSKRDDNQEEMITSASNQSLFPHLHSLNLQDLESLTHIDDPGAKFGGVVFNWSLCQYAREIYINSCNALSSAIPSYAVGQMQKLEELIIEDCKSLKEVFESRGMNTNNGDSGGSIGISTNIDEGNGATLAFSRSKNCNVPQLFHLRKVFIYECDLLEYVFTFSTLKSLRQLEKLTVQSCKGMKEIVKQEINGEQTTAVSSDGAVVFPCLKSVELIRLPNLLGLFLGMNEFEWNSLETVVITECPQVKVFTSGHSTAKKLSFIRSSLGKHHTPECGLNFCLTPTASEGTPWSYQNMVEKVLEFNDDVIKVIPSNELLQVTKLETIQVTMCTKIDEIFEVGLEGTNTVVEIPRLRELKLKVVENLKYIWRNNERTVLKFPNLTTLYLYGCHRLKHAFTSSMVGSLLQLQDLYIDYCSDMEVIVLEEEECDGREKQIELPRLKSLKLISLDSLKGFCLGKEAFSFPSLDTLEIWRCPKLKIFTEGHLTTPKLKRTKTEFGMYDFKENLNSFINTKVQEGPKF